jgi:hypothetical protein
VAVVFFIFATGFFAVCAILAGVTGVVAGSALSLVIKSSQQKMFEDGYLGVIGCAAGLFLGWIYAYAVGNENLLWLDPIWLGLVFAILLPFVHELSRHLRPSAASLSFDSTAGAAPSKWNWLLFPFPFALAYALLTGACWVPLATRTMPSNYVPYFSGQLFAFAVFRIGAVLSLALVSFAFLPQVRCRETIAVAAIAGVLTSALDRFCWGWFNNHGGFYAALFGTPVLAGCILIPLDRYIRSRWAQTLTT